MKEQKEGKKEHIHKTELVVGAGEPKKERHTLPAPQAPEKRAPELKHISHRKGLISDYLQSWKEVPSLKFLLLVMFDLAFYALLYGLFLGYGSLIGNVAGVFKNVDPNTLASQTAEQLTVYQQSLASTLVFVFLISLAFSLLFVLIWTLSRAFIWTRLLDKRITLKYIWKFYLMNLIWTLAWVIVLIALSLVFYKIGSMSKAAGIAMGIIFIVLFIIMVYFMYLLYYIFTEGGNNIFRSLKDAFAVGARKFTSLALPLLMIMGTIAVIGLVSYAFNLLPQIVMETLSYILYFGVFAWMKIFAANVLKERV